MKISAIVLAGGRSKRMGSMKMLLPVGVCNVLERAVGSLLAADVQDIWAVTGFRGGEIEQCVGDLKVHMVRNENFADGMFSSVQTGVRALPPDVDAFFLLPGDIPFVPPLVIRELAAAFSPQYAVLYPRFAGRKGHPPLISARLREEIENADSQIDKGLKAVLSRYDHSAACMEFPFAGLLTDVDTREDYLKVLKEAGSSAQDYPDETACHVLYRKQNTPGKVIGHCRAVTAAALRLAKELRGAAGLPLNMELVRAGALLHDICRTAGREHPIVGAELLRSLGQREVAEIIACHMDIRPVYPPTEKEVVFLADKLVQGDQLVPFRRHMEESLQRFGSNPKTAKIIRSRLLAAQSICHAIEDLVGKRLDQIFPVLQQGNCVHKQREYWMLRDWSGKEDTACKGTLSLR